MTLRTDRATSRTTSARAARWPSPAAPTWPRASARFARATHGRLRPRRRHPRPPHRPRRALLRRTRLRRHLAAALRGRDAGRGVPPRPRHHPSRRCSQGRSTRPPTAASRASRRRRSPGRLAARTAVDAVDVVGIATDHCVRATALDAARAGFATRVLLDLTAGVLPGPPRGRRRRCRGRGGAARGAGLSRDLAPTVATPPWTADLAVPGVWSDGPGYEEPLLAAYGVAPGPVRTPHDRCSRELGP